ncbi:hypothetical protein RMQ97_02035 [Maricaulis sp. D1M11]|uniref:hypothetical protein n=1 Tax=Maricaulis sp. D1M11 TaxID=3076117 RepID=UPI0039B3BE29
MNAIRNIPVLPVICVAGLGLFIVIMSNMPERNPPLPRSALGFDGLTLWLEANDQPVRRVDNARRTEVWDVDLRVLPVFVGRDRPLRFVSGDPETLYLQAPDHEISISVLRRKIINVPTLLVYPKWSDGVRLSGLMHEDFLLHDANPGVAHFGQQRPVALTETDEIGDADDNSDQDFGPDGAVEAALPADPPVLKLPMVFVSQTDVTQEERIAVPDRLGGGQLTVRAPQWMHVRQDCKPLIGDAERALLAQCQHSGWDYWVLSDPDVLNNFGLAQSENSQVALALIEFLSDARDSNEYRYPVMVDYSQIEEGLQDGRARTWADLMRFVQPPFLFLWLGAFLLFLLAFWRGTVRDRPVASMFGFAHGAARRTVMQSQARIMHYTGRNGSMLRILADIRVSQLSRRLIGREPRALDRQALLIDVLHRRDEGLADRLQSLLNEIASLPDRLPIQQAEEMLVRLETVYKEVLERA